MRPHVSVEEALSKIGLATQLAFERPRSDSFMLPLMAFEVVLANEALFADVAHVGLLALVLDHDVLVNAGFV